VQVLQLLLPDGSDPALPSDTGVAEASQKAVPGQMLKLNMTSTIERYKHARKRVLFFDYGGTLLELEGRCSGLW
jgi:hypothetical protein